MADGGRHLRRRRTVAQQAALLLSLMVAVLSLGGQPVNAERSAMTFITLSGEAGTSLVDADLLAANPAGATVVVECDDARAFVVRNVTTTILSLKYTHDECNVTLDDVNVTETWNATSHRRLVAPGLYADLVRGMTEVHMRRLFADTIAPTLEFRTMHFNVAAGLERHTTEAMMNNATFPTVLFENVLVNTSGGFNFLARGAQDASVTFRTVLLTGDSTNHMLERSNASEATITDADIGHAVEDIGRNSDGVRVTVSDTYLQTFDTTYNSSVSSGSVPQVLFKMLIEARNGSVVLRRLSRGPLLPFVGDGFINSRVISHFLESSENCTALIEDSNNLAGAFVYAMTGSTDATVLVRNCAGLDYGFYLSAGDRGSRAVHRANLTFENIRDTRQLCIYCGHHCIDCDVTVRQAARLNASFPLVAVFAERTRIVFDDITDCDGLAYWALLGGTDSSMLASNLVNLFDSFTTRLSDVVNFAFCNPDVAATTADCIVFYTQVYTGASRGLRVSITVDGAFNISGGTFYRLGYNVIDSDVTVRRVSLVSGIDTLSEVGYAAGLSDQCLNLAVLGLIISRRWWKGPCPWVGGSTITIDTVANIADPSVSFVGLGRASYYSTFVVRTLVPTNRPVALSHLGQASVDAALLLSNVCVTRPPALLLGATGMPRMELNTSDRCADEAVAVYPEAASGVELDLLVSAAADAPFITVNATRLRLFRTASGVSSSLRFLRVTNGSVTFLYYVGPIPQPVSLCSIAPAIELVDFSSNNISTVDRMTGLLGRCPALRTIVSYGNSMTGSVALGAIGFIMPRLTAIIGADADEPVGRRNTAAAFYTCGFTPLLRLVFWREGGELMDVGPHPASFRLCNCVAGRSFDLISAVWRCTPTLTRSLSIATPSRTPTPTRTLGSPTRSKSPTRSLGSPTRTRGSPTRTRTRSKSRSTSVTQRVPQRVCSMNNLFVTPPVLQAAALQSVGAVLQFVLPAGETWSSVAPRTVSIAATIATAQTGGFNAHTSQLLQPGSGAHDATAWRIGDGNASVLELHLRATPALRVVEAAEVLRVRLPASAFACAAPSFDAVYVVLEPAAEAALSSAQAATTAAGAVGVAAGAVSGAAAADAQALVVLAFVQCGSSSGRAVPKQVKFLLGPLGMADGPLGIILGNFALLAMLAALQGIVVAIMHFVRKKPWGSACAMGRFPGVTLVAAGLAEQGLALFSLSMILRGDMHPAALAGAAAALAVPALTWWTSRRYAAPSFEAGSGRLIFFALTSVLDGVAPGSMKAKLLAQFAPVGKWGPRAASQRFGSPVRGLLPTWVFFVVAPPLQSLLLGLIAAIPIPPSRVGLCTVQYLAMALVVGSMCVAAVVVRPYRVRAAAWFQVVSSLTIVASVLAAIVMLHVDTPTGALVVAELAAIAQALITMVRTVNAVAVKVAERTIWAGDGRSHVWTAADAARPHYSGLQIDDGMLKLIEMSPVVGDDVPQSAAGGGAHDADDQHAVAGA